MSYFSLLPNTEYSLTTESRVIVKNILVRAKILDFIRTLESSALEYTITDEERPEHIAERVYGRSDYHWIVLLFNEIHDPYFSWPMSLNEMEKHMEKSYPGKALFLNTGGISQIGGAAIRNERYGVAHDRRKPHFEVGSTVRQVAQDGTVLATGTVLSWDPNLWKLVVEPADGIFRLQGDAAKVDVSIGQLGPVNDPLALPRDIRCTNSEGDEISASLLRLTDDNKYALHHFESESGEEISCWHVPSGSASPLIERYICGRQEVIATNEGVYSIVTNHSFEDRRNETKRNIRIMKPNYLDPLLREFNRLMG